MSNALHIPTGIEAIVCGDIAQRQAGGISKYGTTVANNPLNLRAWLNHQYEELLDAAVYARRAIAEIDADEERQARRQHPVHDPLLALPVRDLMPRPAPVGDPRRIVPPVPLGIKRMHPDARMPTYATDGSACFDLYAVASAHGMGHQCDDHAMIFRTGLAFSIPEGWMIEIHSRSGQGFTHAVRLSNCTGIIDSDFTDEVMVALRFDGIRALSVRDGDRIAQARLVPVQQAEFHWLDDIPATGRGGFGSTGR